MPLTAYAPAKVNLTLSLLGRRADGYHELDSLVVFADVADRLTFISDDSFSLSIAGPTAPAAGMAADNLVLKAARALAAEVKPLQPGAFHLDKHLPVAAGLGGGSADAAAALRLLARANGLPPDDPRLGIAARATGADVSVCLFSRPARMCGIGHDLTLLPSLPSLAAVLVNPGVAVSTVAVFSALGLAPGERFQSRATLRFDGCHTGDELMALLQSGCNDLEAPARALAPVIKDVADALTAQGAALTRLSGSGATVFGLFHNTAEATTAAAALSVSHPQWWVRASVLGAPVLA